MEKIKLALLAGGISGERKVSLKTGEQIYKALDKAKYDIVRYDPKSDMKKFIDHVIEKKIDLVFPALHGPFGEDGRLQGLLDMLNVPYVFSGCLAGALSMNKYTAKIIAQDAGLNVIPDITLKKGQDYNVQDIINILSLPAVVKPLELGSSVGVTIAQTEEDLEQGIHDAFKQGDKVLIELYIAGRELTVAVMGNSQRAWALPVIEIIPKVSSWFDYKAKYEKGGSDEICPAELPDHLEKQAKEDGVKIFNAIGCQDLARIDFIWSKIDFKLYFVEINTIPGMTATSLAPQAAKEYGLDFPKFLDDLILSSLNRYKST